MKDPGALVRSRCALATKPTDLYNVLSGRMKKHFRYGMVPLSTIKIGQLLVPVLTSADQQRPLYIFRRVLAT